MTRPTRKVYANDVRAEIVNHCLELGIGNNVIAQAIWNAANQRGQQFPEGYHVARVGTSLGSIHADGKRLRLDGTRVDRPPNDMRFPVQLLALAEDVADFGFRN
ncbi:MAG: hypothetical protein AAB570_00735, partial [Patescibacteria group bacterium]